MQWTKQNEQTVYENRWFTVNLADVELPDGRHLDHFLIRLRPVAVHAGHGQAGGGQLLGHDVRLDLGLGEDHHLGQLRVLLQEVHQERQLEVPADGVEHLLQGLRRQLAGHLDQLGIPQAPGNPPA